MLRCPPGWGEAAEELAGGGQAEEGAVCSTLRELLPELSKLEEKCEGGRGEGSSRPKIIQERLEAVQVRGNNCYCSDVTIVMLA